MRSFWLRRFNPSNVDITSWLGKKQPSEVSTSWCVHFQYQEILTPLSNASTHGQPDKFPSWQKWRSHKLGKCCGSRAVGAGTSFSLRKKPIWVLLIERHCSGHNWSWSGSVSADSCA